VVARAILAGILNDIEKPAPAGRRIDMTLAFTVRRIIASREGTLQRNMR
jgi:hypothetical protein